MLQTYRATLRGNQIEWTSDVPDESKTAQTVEVYITILKENSSAQELRPFGLCAGEFVVPSDFDAPLSEEILRDFEG